MSEDLKQVDTAAATKLAEIKREEDVIRSYLDRASENKEHVSALVYQRVVGDYNDRRAALSKRAAPLREEARREHRKLSALLTRLQSAFEQATSDKQEIEFRHAIGELSEKQLTERLKQTERVLAERQSALAAAAELEQLFLAAFGSREAIQEESAPAAPMNLDRTNLVDLGSEIESRTVVRPRTSEGPPSQPSSDKTFIMPPARLVADQDGEVSEYALGALNYIGRTGENQIQLASAGVSRRHAVVMMSASGFTVKDLESQNGTFVNDNRVNECRLSDGDRIRIGNVDLVFHLS